MNLTHTTEQNPASGFAAGTLILTEYGYLPIEAVKPGIRVLTHKGRWRSITNISISEQAPIAIIPEGATMMECGAGQRFYIKKPQAQTASWVSAADISEPCRYGMANNIAPLPIPKIKNTSDLATSFSVDARLLYVAGRYVRNGCVQEVGQYKVLVLPMPPDEGVALPTKMKKDWGKIRHSKNPQAVETAPDGIFELHSKDGGGSFTLIAPPVVEWLEQQFGDEEHGKNIPGWLLGASVELKSAFLAGFVDKAYQNTFGENGGVAVASPSLAYGLKALISGVFGLKTEIKPYQNVDKGNDCAAIIFDFLTNLWYNSIDTIDSVECLHEFVPIQFVFWGKQNVPYPKQAATQQDPFSLLESHFRSNDGQEFLVRRAPTLVRSVPLYDIRVAEDDSFVANGCFVRRETAEDQKNDHKEG